MTGRLCDTTTGWKKVPGEWLFWPETNRPAKEVYQLYGVGKKLVYRKNQDGKVIWDNEKEFCFRNALA